MLTFILVHLAGSYKCRVGWASDEKPRLVFKNITAKSRHKKVNYVGNQSYQLMGSKG